MVLLRRKSERVLVKDRGWLPPMYSNCTCDMTTRHVCGRALQISSFIGPSRQEKGKCDSRFVNGSAEIFVLIEKEAPQSVLADGAVHRMRSESARMAAAPRLRQRHTGQQYRIGRSRNRSADKPSEVYYCVDERQNNLTTKDIGAAAIC